MQDNQEYKSGQDVPGSGIYAVSHAHPQHANHEVTLLYGSRFPACKECGTLSFRLVAGAHSAGYYDFLISQ